MAAPNEKEIAALKMFRHRISDLNADLDDYMQHDMTLLRFLRARELNLEKSEFMFRKHLQWRTDNDLDNIRNVKLSDLVVDGFPFKACGFDKEGYLVVLIPFGKRWDLRNAMDNGYRNEFFIYTQQLFEQALAFCKYKSTKEKCFTQINIIIDYEDFSLRQIASREVVEAILDILRVFEANFPETLKTCYVVNAPTVFHVLYKLVKPLMSAHTLAKLQIFGGNKDEWRAALLKTIDASQLPSEYGGSNTTCIDYKMNMGFEVFPKYETFDEDEMKSVTVLPGQKFKVDLHDIDQGTYITWNFLTIDHNIGFSVCMEDNEEVIGKMRVDSHLNTQKGQIIADKAGKYTLVFDNSFSKFRAKQLKYTVCTKNPHKYILQ